MADKYIIKSVDLKNKQKLPGYADYSNNLYNSYEEASIKRDRYIAQKVKKGEDIAYGIFKLINIRAAKLIVETEEVKFED